MSQFLHTWGLTLHRKTNQTTRPMNATTTTASASRSIILSERVLNTINSLPVDDRIAIASAIAGEIILGASAAGELTPLQNLVFAMIRQYVKHDTDNCVIIPRA